MRICVDIRCLMEGRRTGVEEYTLGILKNLLLLDKKNVYVLFFNSWKNPVFDFSYFSQFKNVRLKKSRVPNKILNFFFWYLGWPKIDRLAGGADVVFMPNIIFGSVSRRVKLVVTIHDLSFERHGEYFSRKRKWWHLFINTKKICDRADKIIAVSASTKNDIMGLYEIKEEKIEIIPSAAGEKFRVISRNDAKLVVVKEKYRLPYKFILNLSTIEPRKNISGVVQAYAALQKYAHENNNAELAKYKLVIAGERGWLGEKIYDEINRSEYKESIQVVGSVLDEDKEYFYNLASLFVYPSFFEGFGFPPLEAMQCGVPVIASNNSSLPEVVGNAGILVDPDRPDEIYRAMKEILENRELREILIKKGLERAKEFDWKKTAQKTLEIFNEVEQ
jgi:glycosyltransferase involved in cell wall biosynthesis